MYSIHFLVSSITSESEQRKSQRDALAWLSSVFRLETLNIALESRSSTTKKDPKRRSSALFLLVQDAANKTKLYVKLRLNYSR